MSRGFIFGLVFFALGAQSWKLQIIHTNDLHARYEETNTYSATCSVSLAKNGNCFGGFARIRAVTRKAIEEAKKKGIASLVLNGGDTFQGTPYYTLYKWKMAAQLIEMLNIDVMTLGNHEFDDGVDNLVSYLKNIKTPVVVCNLNTTYEKRLEGLDTLRPSVIVEKGGVKIGVVGYLTPETMMTSETENLLIDDEIEHIREETKRLKKEGAVLVIALGHSGLSRDIEIAREVEGVNLIVGAHSHSLMYTPKNVTPSTEPVVESYPYMVTQASGKKVPIVQAYAYSKYLGKLIIEFDDKGDISAANGNPVILDSSVPKDKNLTRVVMKWTSVIEKRLKTIKGYTRVFLKTSNFNTYEFESNLANLVVDSFFDYGVRLARLENVSTWTSAPIVFYQNGGIRIQISQTKDNGAITVEDILMILPFQNKLVEVQLAGRTIREALEKSVSTFDTTTTMNYLHLLHHAGIRVVYNLDNPVGNRVQTLRVLCTDCSVPKYYALDDNKIYTVISVTFLMNGGDGYTMFKEQRLNYRNLNVTDADVLADYIERHDIIYPGLDERIITEHARENSAARNFKVYYSFSILILSLVLIICS